MWGTCPCPARVSTSLESQACACATSCTTNSFTPQSHRSSMAHPQLERRRKRQLSSACQHSRSFAPTHEGHVPHWLRLSTSIFRLSLLELLASTTHIACSKVKSSPPCRRCKPQRHSQQLRVPMSCPWFHAARHFVNPQSAFPGLAGCCGT